MIRFNTLDEQLFVCQSLLKEWRRPPTGGLLEALKKSLGGGIHALFPCCGVEKTTLRASEVLFSPVGRKTTGYCFVRNCPHRGVSCRRLFSCGEHERAYSGRVRNPENLRGAFLGRKSLPSFTNYDLNKEDGQKDAFLHQLVLGA